VRTLVLALAVAAALAAGASGYARAGSRATAGRAAAAPPAAMGQLAGAWKLLPPAPVTKLPPAYSLSSAWTGREMIIHGIGSMNSAGARGVTFAYRPATSTWKRLPRGPKPVLAQENDFAVWTGSEMLVLGLTSAAYNPATDKWRPIARPDLAPSQILGWTGREAILWEGTCCGGQASRGAAYNPATGKWREFASPLAPRVGAIGAWTGRELVVAGGLSQPSGVTVKAFRDGAAYNPATHTWRKLARMPLGRFAATAVWDGREILFLGGKTGNRLAVRGLAYSPAANRWRWLPKMPYPRSGFAAVWTGRQVLVWGGLTAAGIPPPHGETFDPAASRWTALPSAPLHGRVVSAAAWTGRRMIVWGGYTASRTFLDGAAFTPRTP
jgi:hypothetical protein